MNKIYALITFIFFHLLCYADYQVVTNQQQLEKILEDKDKEELKLVCLADYNSSFPFDLQILSSLNKLKNLEIIYRGQILDYSIFWDSIFSLPQMDNLISFRINVHMLSSINYYKSSYRQLWDFTATHFPNINILEINGLHLDGSIMETPEKEDTLEKLAELVPNLEELHLNHSFYDRIVGIEYFQNLRVLDLEQTMYFGNFYKTKENNFLYKLKKLKKLNIGNPRTLCGPEGDCRYCNYVPSEFFQLGDFPELEDLNLSALSFESLFLSNFAPNLKKLNLNEATLNQSRLDDLAFLTQLEELSLSGVDLCEHHIEQLNLISFPNLTKLDLSQSNTKGLLLSTLAPQLKILNLTHCPVTPSNLKDIANLDSLEELILEKTKISGASLKNLAYLTKLKKLNLRKTNIRNGALDSLVHLTNLDELDLSETNLALEDFAKLPSLQQLKILKLEKISNPNIGSTEFEGLKKALPQCDIKY